MGKKKDVIMFGNFKDATKWELLKDFGMFAIGVGSLMLVIGDSQLDKTFQGFAPTNQTGKDAVNNLYTHITNQS